MQLLAALPIASDGYLRRLEAVPAGWWLGPSVCEGWTIKDLADHVVGGNRFAVALLAGQSAEDAFGSALAAGFGDDPVVAHRASADAQLEAFSAPGALDRLVAHPAGEIDGRQFLGFRLGDIVLHGWDLARSFGGDDSLDDELVPLIWDAYQPVLGSDRQRAAFGLATVAAGSDGAPLAQRLLALTGRL